MTLTVPAGSVADDLPGFPLSLRLRVDAPTQTFVFQDSGGHTLPYVKVSYRGGYLDALVRCDLTAGSDNVITLTAS